MKIDTLVVLYNPKEEFLDHFRCYTRFSSRVIFLDNSTEISPDFVKQIQALPHASYLSLHGNQGIAKALRLGMEEAIKDEADYALTMDQDSVFPEEKLSAIQTILTDPKNQSFGIIGLNFNSKETSLTIQEKRWWLTSGNFVNVRKYQKLKTGFRDDLFIDAVDTDIGHSFHQAGFKVGYIKGISLIHEIGHPKTYHFLFLTFHTLNYQPLRYYYIFRNNYYLYHLDKVFFKKDKNYVKWDMYWKVRLFEDNKAKKLLAIKYGKEDAKKGILGPCQHPDIL
jgi:rhamnosyltransferase